MLFRGETLQHSLVEWTERHPLALERYLSKQQDARKYDRHICYVDRGAPSLKNPCNRAAVRACAHTLTHAHIHTSVFTHAHAHHPCPDHAFSRLHWYYPFVVPCTSSLLLAVSPSCHATHIQATMPQQAILLGSRAQYRSFQLASLFCARTC